MWKIVGKDLKERYLRENKIILFYSDVKGFHRDISTKDSRAAWDELLAKIGEAGDAFWTRDIGEILNHIWVETDFWTLRYIQLFVQKFRDLKGSSRQAQKGRNFCSRHNHKVCNHCSWAKEKHTFFLQDIFFMYFGLSYVYLDIFHTWCFFLQIWLSLKTFQNILKSSEHINSIWNPLAGKFQIIRKYQDSYETIRKVSKSSGNILAALKLWRKF